MKKKVLTSLLIVLLSFFKLEAKKDTLFINPDFTYKAGFILPHSGAVKVLMNGRVDYAELTLTFPRLGTDKFKRNNPYSYWGVSLNYTNFSNPDYLGFGLGIVPNLEMPLFKGTKFKGSLRFGFGWGYIHKVFGRTENIRNLIISSHGNNLSDFQFRFRYLFSPKYEIYTGFGLMHYSNGAWKRPNLGINLPYAHLGVRWNKKPLKKHEFGRDTLPKQKYVIHLSLNGGLKGGNYAAENKFGVIGLSGVFSRKWENHKLGVAFDLTYDQGLEFLAETSELDGTSTKLKFHEFFTAGSLIAYERLLGNVSLYVQIGGYLVSPYTTIYPNKDLVNHGGQIYNRMGVRYYFKKLYAGVGVKAHLGEADLAEFSVGYRLFSK